MLKFMDLPTRRVLNGLEPAGYARLNVVPKNGRLRMNNQNNTFAPSIRATKAASFGNSSIDQRILDFVKRLPTPSPGFNEDVFYLKGSTLLEDIIGDLLKSHGITPARATFDEKIKALKAIPMRPIPNKAVRALHSFRRARNEYVHHTWVTPKGKRIESRYIASVEKACRYDGQKLFPVLNRENQRQWRLYFATTILWEIIKNLAKPNDDFYPTRELLNALCIELQNSLSRSS
jgi:hypothetical protein